MRESTSPRDGETPTLTGRDASIAAIRALQAEWAGYLAPRDPGEKIQLALDTSSARRATARYDGLYVRYPKTRGFKYLIEDEEDRWRRTDEIIERSRPGQDENPLLFESLAREAAAIEGVVHLAPSSSNQVGGSPPPHVLLGTIAEPRSHAFLSEVGVDRLLLVSAGMTSFLRQLAKAVVLAWEQNPTPPGTSASFSYQDIETEADTPATEMLIDVFSNWLYAGFPYDVGITLDEDRELPFNILETGAQRFVVAHEYGHALGKRLGIVPPTSPASTDGDTWRDERAADMVGLELTRLSAWQYDHLCADFAWQGVILAMKAHELLDRAVALAFAGEHKGVASSAHPPFAERARSVVSQYEAQEEPDECMRLRLSNSTENLLIPARTLELLWSKARHGLVALHRSGLGLHDIWSSALRPSAPLPGRR